METTKFEIFNHLFNDTSVKSGSIYFQTGAKLVRIADHKAKYYNVEERNEGVEEMLIIYVNSELTEKQMQENVDELEKKMNISVDFLIFKDGDELFGNLDLLNFQVNRFLNL